MWTHNDTLIAGPALGERSRTLDLAPVLSSAWQWPPLDQRLPPKRGDRFLGL